MSQKVVITGIATSNLPKMTAKESEQMLKRIKTGETNLREAFINGNMRLVLSLVQRFNANGNNADDLFQVGVLGLIKALDNFDVTLNVRFSTYAVPMILGEIKRYIREGTALKVGRGIRDVAYRAMQARDRLELSRTNEVSLMEIASEIGTPYAEVVSALDAISAPVSIFDSVYSDGEDSMLVVDQISDTKSLEETINSITLTDEISKLPERERLVIQMRYYQGKTQMEISQSLLISQAQVSRLEKSALSQIRLAF